MRSVAVRDDYLRELALAISLVSLGSSQTFFLPQRRTLEASLFWSRSILRRTTHTAQPHARSRGRTVLSQRLKARDSPQRVCWTQAPLLEQHGGEGGAAKGRRAREQRGQPRSAVLSLGLPSARVPAAISPPPQRAAQPPFSPEA